jgi:hypothetical protein
LLWETIDPAYLKSKIDNLDLSITGLRDALRGTANKTLTDIDTDLGNIYARTDVALSTRAAETTLSTLSGKFPSATALGDALGNPTTTIIGGALLGFDGTNWERIMTDGSNRLKAQLDALPNPENLDITLSALRDALLSGTGTYPGGLDDIYNKLNAQLDVVLSTRASESTLSNIYSRLDVALSTRLADSKIPNALAQISKDIAGSTVYGLAVIASLAHDITRMPYMVDDIDVTTTEASTSITAPGGKVVKVTNKGDTDALIGVNGSVPVTNPLKVRARTAKIFLFGGATSIYYKTSSGSTTISIEYFN